MKFLVDRCAGHRLAEWLRRQGHDVAESRDRGPDPGDREILDWAVAEQRVLVTMGEVLRTHSQDLASRSIVTVRGDRVRISRPPSL